MNIVRLDQKFDDHAAMVIKKLEEISRWQQAHDVTSEAWRTSIDARLSPFEDFKTKIEGPAKIIGFVVLLILTPIFSAVGVSLYAWFHRWLINHQP